jgi:Leucine-rich repeat (LRR) protein
MKVERSGYPPEKEDTAPTIRDQISGGRSRGFRNLPEPTEGDAMARNDAYRKAEERIKEARRSGATELNFSYQLSTDLPESLSQLTQLKSLDLTGNQLRALPDWLGRFIHLQSLNLSGNQLTALPESLVQLTHLQSLNLAGNQLTALPEWLGRLTQLLTLTLSGHELTVLPEWLGRLTQLQSLNLSNNQLRRLPEWLDRLMQLQSLDLGSNQLEFLPEQLGHLTKLTSLRLASNKLTSLPEWLIQLRNLESLSVWGNPLSNIPPILGELPRLKTFNFRSDILAELPPEIFNLRHLTWLDASGNATITTLSEDIGRLEKLERLTLTGSRLSALPAAISQLNSLSSLDLSSNQLVDLPESLLQLNKLEALDLRNNPLNPELAAAYTEGLVAVKRYLSAKATAQAVLNEAKLIFVGEGEVGKSCLLGALRGDEWEEGRPTTHGIEIKPIKLIDPDSGREITLNGWDFGGQRVYRPTHQLFFSSPAVYLVVWKPREGPQQGFVKEWIKLVKHREPDAKILVVATHGGPGQRQPDVDRQEIWDLFGRNTVQDFFLVDSKPDEKTGERPGVAKLKEAIARVAASLPEMGRTVPARWQQAREALQRAGSAYLPLDRVLDICREHKMEEEEARLFVKISHRLGHLIYYEHDPTLRDVVVLKPDWLATAISFVLDDKQTREAHGLVSFARLGQLWNDPTREEEFRYPPELHPVFLRLMERFDLSYKVALPSEVADEVGFWQRIGSAFAKPSRQVAEIADLRYESLIAQLVPDIRPEEDLNHVWTDQLGEGDEQQVQICRIVDARTGQSATAEGLFYQLIVRLHKFSLGRVSYKESVHWQRGLVLDDDYNGRALLEHLTNDVHITVHAPSPITFLSVLTHEVKWLVENFWEGLRCEVVVPCVEPCGKGEPGRGVFEVQKLIAFKRQGMTIFPCFVSGCNQTQDINRLLRNAPAARRISVEQLLAQGFDQIRSRLDGVREQLNQQDRNAQERFQLLDQNDRRIMSQVEDAFRGLIQALIDEAKEGPRLFSFQPVALGFFDRPKWINEKFRLTLWCEHSRLPLSALNEKEDRRGIYDLNLPREWFVKAAPFFKVLTSTLSLVLPMASSATKLLLNDSVYKGIEKELDLGQKSIDSLIKGGEKIGIWLGQSDAPDLEHGEAIHARGAILRELHALLKEKDPGFGGLVRVRNKRQEFLWVHPQFEREY